MLNKLHHVRRALGWAGRALMKGKRFFLWAFFLAALAGFGGGLFYAGYKIGLAQPHVLTLNAVENTDTPKDLGLDFNIFWQTWNVIRESALASDEVSDKDLLYGAANGLLGSLGDPYSVFMKPADATKFNQDVQGSFGGVGMRIDVKDGRLIVVQPLKNTPSEKAGVKADDSIIKINDTYAADMSVDNAVKLIRGAVGTNVNVTLMRAGWTAPKEFTLTREIIQVPTLDYELKDGSIAYVQLYSFNENVPQLFFDAVKDMFASGAKGMVLDLRGNPGGFLDVAVHLAGWFVDNGSTIVVEEFRSGTKNIFRSKGNSFLKPVPLVILVDGASASASEILAGALHDLRGAILVGEKTFGKGTVQELKWLTDGSQVKITVAHWLLPKGALIDKNGIEPDVKVVPTDKDIETGNDVQLKKALEIMKQEIDKASQ